LTLEDVLHPQEEDCIPNPPAQEKDRRYLQNVLEMRLHDDPKAISLSNCLIDWGISELRPHCPDITVLFGVRRRPRSEGTFRLTHHGGRPVLVIEITSPDTRGNDVITKVRHYHQAHVPLYIIVDRVFEDGPPILIGYRYTARGYVKMRPDKQGRLLVKPLGLRIGVRENRVVCYDAATDEELGDYPQVRRALRAEAAARKAAEEAASAAKEAAAAAQQQASAAKEAAAAQQQASAAKEAAAAAKKRAEAAEKRIRELEAKLARLNGRGK
jgi:Uma2 family endonuclease